MKSIVLIGFATAGKTTSGQIVANKLGLPFLDTDVLLQQTYGATVNALLSLGKDRFRALENDLIKILPLNDAVISCGGGLVLNDNFYKLTDCTVVWLKVSASQCLKRLGNVRRPLHDGKSQTELQAMLDCRNNVYSKVAQVVIDTDKKTPTQVANEIASIVGL